MKDDYLWDMTGGDPEITRLETMLEVFRYQKTDAPALPVVNSLLEIEYIRKRRFVFAFAFAVIATVVTAAGVWFQSLRTTNVEEDLAVSAPPPTESGSRTEPVVSGDDEPGAIGVNVVEQPARRRVVGRNAARALSDQQTNSPFRGPKDRKKARLTEKERYAYGQLMLALTITSAKLKIVQDTIDGVEDGSQPAKVYER